MPKDRVVLGVDPGVASTGIAVVAESGGRYETRDYSCVSTRAGQRFPDRLAVLNAAIRRAIRRFRPDDLAMERLFFSRNVKTAVAVGQAQGAILLAAARSSIGIHEYTPMQVKMAVTGNGTADKSEVAIMMMRLLNLDDIPRPDDAADALAIAYCHLVSTRIRFRHD